MARGRGSGVTPQRVVDLIKNEVEKTSILATSKALGVGLAAIDRYLKGVGEPTTKTLQKIADYFKVSVAWLREDFDEEGNFEQDYEIEKRVQAFSLLSKEEKLSFVFENWDKFDKELQDQLLPDLDRRGERYARLVDEFLAIPLAEHADAIDYLTKIQSIVAKNPDIVSARTDGKMPKIMMCKHIK